jgi:urocanate hydratase
MARGIKAQRGSTLRCRGWRQESILRMLENNLENGEDPENLVIYTGARAARSWDDFDRIVAALKELEGDETLVCQSGRAVAKFRSHPRAPRVVMANGNVLGRWGNPDQFFELEQKGLTAKPGMTAAAWQYIGSQGILQGTYQSFIGAAHQFFGGGDLRGRLILTAGCGGMGGAQPLAGKLAGAAILVVEPSRAKIERRIASGYCDRVTDSLDEALAWLGEAKASRTPLSVGLVGNAAVVHPELIARGIIPDIVTDQTNTDPYKGYIPAGMTPDEAADLEKRDLQERKRKAEDSMRAHARALLEFRRRGAIVFEYGNGLRLRTADLGETEMLTLESFVTMFIRPLFCDGFGPFRWLAISGDPQDIAEVDGIVESTFSHNHPINQWIPLAREHVHFTGLPARIGWLGHGERSLLATKVNTAVAEGRLKGPIAFTRDHLDAGSVANPFRESEKMQDGSEAISDWPILNALLACANGADLVAVHSMGGYSSQSAGQTTVADGTIETADRLRAVLDGDTGIGIMRHAEAGYEKALENKRAFGLGFS